jgi:chromosome partitioning protein
MNENEIALEDIMQDTIMAHLDIVPATTSLSGVEVDLVNMSNSEKRLKSALEKFHKIYRYIIIDCPPSLELLTINSLVAADTVLIL